MLLKPDKLPSLTTSYRPISLISSIMKLFERVIEQRLRSHLEHIGFTSKHQSGFRKAKSTDDQLFRLSQSIMESFNRREHVVDAFLDVEKAFDNVWHNRLRFKIYQLDLPTKMTHWLSEFLVGRLIQSQRKQFFIQSNQPQGRGTTGFCPESITFLDLRQWSSNTAPQTKLFTPIHWWYRKMGLQSKHTYCSKTFTTGPSKIGIVVCQMENQT